MGLDFFRLEEMTPSSSSAFSCSSCAEADMCYGQSLLQPGEWIITKETPKLGDGTGFAFCDPEISHLFMSSYLQFFDNGNRKNDNAVT